MVCVSLVLVWVVRCFSCCVFSGVLVVRIMMMEFFLGVVLGVLLVVNCVFSGLFVSISLGSCLKLERISVLMV